MLKTCDCRALGFTFCFPLKFEVPFMASPSLQDPHVCGLRCLSVCLRCGFACLEFEKCLCFLVQQSCIALRLICRSISITRLVRARHVEWFCGVQGQCKLILASPFEKLHFLLLAAVMTGKHVQAVSVHSQILIRVPYDSAYCPIVVAVHFG